MPDLIDESIPSPCIRNCCLNEDDICLGCFRSLLEITKWADSDNAAREFILKNALARRRSHNERYGEFKIFTI